MWPRKALGIPVRMRSAPSTPKPGSSFVSRWRGSGVDVADADVVCDAAAELELVGVGVTVTLRTTGITVEIGMSELPERNVVVIVAEVVSAETEGVREAGVVLEVELD